ncbi:MAG: 30S ribosomal protein S2, partial [Rhodospirillales bacterium]
IPGNDDAIRAINLYCDLLVESVLDGIKEEMTVSGVDLGASEEGLSEALPEEAGAVAEAVSTEAGAEAQPEQTT